MRVGTMALASSLIVGGALVAPLPSFASGHGPVYGLATPTLGQGGWSSTSQRW